VRPKLVANSRIIIKKYIVVSYGGGERRVQGFGGKT
jgi:hypothetical protein